jgi:hypothetical protein
MFCFSVSLLEYILNFDKIQTQKSYYPNLISKSGPPVSPSRQQARPRDEDKAKTSSPHPHVSDSGVSHSICNSENTHAASPTQSEMKTSPRPLPLLSVSPAPLSSGPLQILAAATGASSTTPTARPGPHLDDAQRPRRVHTLTTHNALAGSAPQRRTTHRSGPHLDNA